MVGGPKGFEAPAPRNSKPPLGTVHGTLQPGLSLSLCERLREICRSAGEKSDGESDVSARRSLGFYDVDGVASMHASQYFRVGVHRMIRIPHFAQREASGSHSVSKRATPSSFSSFA